MTADIDIQSYLPKAEECLASANADYVAGRYNSCANRCYFACFHAAVAAQLRAGLLRIGPTTPINHGRVQAQFARELVNRRKELPGSLRGVLRELMDLRQSADYEPAFVSESRASRGLRRARPFVDAVTSRGGQQR